MREHWSENNVRGCSLLDNRWLAGRRLTLQDLSRNNGRVIAIAII